jgi:hypothetical protein
MDSRRSEAIKQKEALSGLTAHPGWIMLRDILQAQIARRSDEILLVPTGDMNTELQQEFKKGEVTAMRTLLQLPEVLLENTKEIIEVTNDDRAGDARDGTDDAEPDFGF